MESFDEHQLQEARRALDSLCAKCEKALEKLRPGTPQHTLTVWRIAALQVALQLIDREMPANSGGPDIP